MRHFGNRPDERSERIAPWNPPVGPENVAGRRVGMVSRLAGAARHVIRQSLAPGMTARTRCTRRDSSAIRPRGGEGDFLGRTMYFSTVDLLTETPSFASSPTMRGEPQPGFAVDILRMSSRSSRATAGLPLLGLERWASGGERDEAVRSSRDAQGSGPLPVARHSAFTRAISWPSPSTVWMAHARHGSNECTVRSASSGFLASTMGFPTRLAS